MSFANASYHCDGVPAVRTIGEPGSDEGIAMFIIDPQNDFHPPNGSLGVPGAVEDMERVVELIRRLGEKVMLAGLMCS